MNGGFKPHRRLRSELLPLAVALTVPFALIALFPTDALRAHPTAPQTKTVPACAFVTLSPEQEKQALMAARTSWQRTGFAHPHKRIDLFAKPLPPLPPRPVLATPETDAVSSSQSVYTPDLMPPSLAAPPPARIEPEPNADKVSPPFPREELLKLN